MFCSRIDHFLKLNSTNDFNKCCFMVQQPRFRTVAEMESSAWLSKIKGEMANDVWPAECLRCRSAEESGVISRRQDSNNQHKHLVKICPDYLRINFEVDTVCNAACQTCGPELSTFYAKLLKVPVTDYSGLTHLAEQYIDPNRIIEIDLTGGEPAVSKSIRHFLESGIDNFPLSLLRIYTNGSAKIRGLERLLSKGLRIDLYMSMDGTDRVFEYCRFPIKWQKFCATLNYYKDLATQYDNLTVRLWGALTSLSILDLDNILDFAAVNNLMFNGAIVGRPDALRVEKNNFLTRYGKELLLKSNHEYARNLAAFMVTDKKETSDELNAHIAKADSIRNIRFEEYYPNIKEN